jgi:hypothetical protein
MTAEVVGDIHPFPMEDGKFLSAFFRRRAAIAFIVNHYEHHGYAVRGCVLSELPEISFGWHFEERIYKLDPVEAEIFSRQAGKVKRFPFSGPPFFYQGPLSQGYIVRQFHTSRYESSGESREGQPYSMKKRII